MWMTKVGWQLLFPRKTNWISENNKNAATFTVSSFLERNSESDPEPAERWVIRLCLLDLPWVNAGVHVTSGIGFLKWMLSAHCVCWWRKDLYPTDKHSPFIPALTGSSHQMSWSMGACFKTDCRRWTTVPSHWERELSLFALHQSKDHWRKKWTGWSGESIMVEVISKSLYVYRSSWKLWKINLPQHTQIIVFNATPVLQIFISVYILGFTCKTVLFSTLNTSFNKWDY